MLRLVAAGLVALALALTPVALGGDNGATRSVYGGQGTPTEDIGLLPPVVTSGGNPTTPGGSLPFTGLDLGLVTLAGVALIGTGISLRRMSRNARQP